MRFLLSLLLCLFLSTVLGADIEKILSGMSLREKIGQMTQIDINAMISKDLNETNARLSPALTNAWLSTYKIGSILDSPFSSLRFSPKVRPLSQSETFYFFDYNIDRILPFILSPSSLYVAT